MKENIILIGFMGCGKTTVGKIIAEKLNFNFIDTDELIVQKMGMPISEIFKTQGEEAFRKIESDLLVELNEHLNHTVISTGGGLPLKKENAALLQTLGIVNYLHVSKQVVLERLKGDTTRPLLAGDDVDKKVEALLSTRNPLYEAAAHLVINAEDGSPEEIAERIIVAFKAKFSY